MKYRMGSLTLEAIDGYVRVTVENLGGIDSKPVVKCTKRSGQLRGKWPNW